MSKISIVRCSDYNAQKVEKAVREAVLLAGGIEKFIKKGERVLLKPNLLAPKAPALAVTTHPEVLRAVIRLVKDAGATPFVGDSPGGTIVGSSGNKRALALLDKYWADCGMKKICEEEGAEIVSFETGGVEVFEFKNRKGVPKINISKVALSFDSVINIPKLKTHGMVLYTGAIKNLYGCVPGLKKAEYHMQAVHPDVFSQILVDIFSVIKPKLAIMDGIIGMDGNGPSNGRIKNFGVIIAGGDNVALDAVSSMVIGLNRKEISAINIAGKQGLGEADIKKIEVVGEKLENVKQADFVRPSNSALKYFPQIFANIVSKLIWVLPKINETKCTRCMTCVKSCPAKAIEMHGKNLRVDIKKCIKCMCCHELCTYGSIDIELSWLASKLVK
ncbi:MAG: DUF362 domain-containing protein [Elusimicrobia bacterium]|nr:DUF362 domain-containing protein [Elusimicrobiota bacterium]